MVIFKLVVGLPPVNKRPPLATLAAVLVPDEEKSIPLIEETYEPEPPKLEPIKEKKGFWEWHEICHFLNKRASGRWDGP